MRLCPLAPPRYLTLDLVRARRRCRSALSEDTSVGVADLPVSVAGLRNGSDQEASGCLVEPEAAPVQSVPERPEQDEARRPPGLAVGHRNRAAGEPDFLTGMTGRVPGVLTPRATFVE